MSDQFYHQGKFFDNEEDFWKCVKEWPVLKLDQETLDRLINTLKKDMIMNTFFLYDRNLFNGEMQEILEDVFLYFMKKLNERKGQ